MADSQQQLIRFYQGAGADAQGRTHAEILAWSDAALEAVHDYIQWLFPLPEPSGANPQAPLLTPPVLAAFAESTQMQARLLAAYRRMLAFYGFTLTSDSAVIHAPAFAARARTWLTPHNHNHLRLTRILRCLHLTAFEAESRALFAALRALYDQDAQTGHRRITPETFTYWQRAAPQR